MKKPYEYDVQLKPRFPVRPVAIDLSGEKGRGMVLAAAKRVLVTHAKVITALGKR